MKFTLFERRSPAFWSICILLAFSSLAFSQNKNWKPISAAEMQMQSPKIEPDAEAEALLWEVYVSDEDTGGSLQSVLDHYLRIKIFSERGRDSFSKVDIPFGRIQNIGLNVRIKDIAARTTKPDGSVIELKDSEIFERDVVKGDGIRLKAKSFAIPGIEPGAIIEYRWREIRGAVSYHQRLEFAREIPVHLIKYYIKALAHPEYGMAGQPFNIKNTPFVKEKTGFWSTTATDVPSFKPEPQMPPEYAVRPWMLLYYAKDTKVEPDKYWKDHGKTVFETHKGLTKMSDEVRRAAAEAVGNETDAEKKVEKIFNYVRAKIKYIYDDALNLSADALKEIKANKNPTDTLKRGQGNMHDINMVFVAMANAAGLDSRVVNLPLRSDVFFPKWFTDDYFMRSENVAVKIGDVWKFYDPSSRYITYGMLAWNEEGQPALISDPKEPVWGLTTMSPPSKSTEKRTGKFKLLEDGTLEGAVRMEFTGHIGAYHKEYNDDDSPQRREETLKNLVKYNVLGSADVSDIAIENVSDPDKPFTYIFKVKIPGYASRTGKRIFLQPNVFERSAKPMFETTKRQYEVYFQYPYAEVDDITIELPAGYDLESPDAPAVVADRSRIGINDIKMFVSADKKSLIYKRNFSFGNGGVVRFDTQAYPTLKLLFEAFYKANSHAITLKQSASTATAKE